MSTASASKAVSSTTKIVLARQHDLGSATKAVLPKQSLLGEV